MYHANFIINAINTKHQMLWNKELDIKKWAESLGCSQLHGLIWSTEQPRSLCCISL